MVRTISSKNFISKCKACAAPSMQTLQTICSKRRRRKRPSDSFNFIIKTLYFHLFQVLKMFPELTWFWEMTGLSGVCNDCVSTKYIKKPDQQMTPEWTGLMINEILFQYNECMYSSGYLGSSWEVVQGRELFNCNE